MRKLYVAATRDGRSTFVEDVAAPTNPFSSVPGFDAAVIWGTSERPTTQWDGKRPTSETSVMPDAGGTKLWVVTFPPDSVMADPGFDFQAAGAEYAEKLPGLAERFEMDNPGMHATDTVDYDVVLDGEITIELDDGERRFLKRGDIVVQHGTRHAWRNLSDKPATLLFVLIGAHRD